MRIDAVIADDEKELRIHLTAKLAKLWPELVIAGEAQNGIEALEMIDSLQPAVAFLDIKMPGLSGIEVARKIKAPCRVVFITAFDQYAVEAFEDEAIDYLLKPVTSERLERTVKRLKRRMTSAALISTDMAAAMERLMASISTMDKAGKLKWIRVRQGDAVRLIAVDDVCYFKAEDKYTVVRTREGESLIKTSIRQLTGELDPDQFWQIHRGTIINVRSIAKVSRSFAGRLIVSLESVPETLSVSRPYAHLFKQM